MKRIKEKIAMLDNLTYFETVPDEYKELLKELKAELVEVSGTVVEFEEGDW